MMSPPSTSCKRVLIVTDAAFIDGGVSQVAIRSAIGLVEAGFEVHYFAALGPIDPLLAKHLGTNVCLIEQYDIKNDPNRLRAATQGIFNFQAVRKFQELIARIGSEHLVVHVHGWAKALSPYLLHYLARSHLPVVTTIHDYFLACPNGGFYEYPKGKICRRRPLSLDCITCNCDSRQYAHKLWRVARAEIQRYGMRIPARLRHFITLSPLSRQVIQPFLPVQASLHEVPNPIFVEKAERTRAEHNEIFLFIGRFSREKGAVQLAEAAGRAGIPLVFVGDGHLRAQMERLAPQATFTGWLDPQAVNDWIKKARVVVFPSTWYEAQPLVPIEAAAAGVPCLVSDCTAATDYLPNDVRAIHFDHQNPSDLEAALHKAADNALITRLSQNAYNWFWDKPWTVARHVADLTSVYEQVYSSVGSSVPDRERHPSHANPAGG